MSGAGLWVFGSVGEGFMVKVSLNAGSVFVFAGVSVWGVTF